MKKEKTGKIFGIINILDLLFVLVIAGAIVVGVLYLNTGGFKKGNRVTVYYTVELEGMIKGFHEFFNDDDVLKDSVKGYLIGSIDNVEIKESHVWKFNKITNRYFKEIHDNLEVLLVTLRADGYETDTSITLDSGVEIKIGKRMYLEGRDFAAWGYTVGMRTEPKEDK